jgi:hypothetical protein
MLGGIIEGLKVPRGRRFIEVGLLSSFYSNQVNPTGLYPRFTHQQIGSNSKKRLLFS